MSLRAELLRLGLRFVKHRSRPDASIEDIRRGLEPIKWFVPRPPKGTLVRKISAGGVRAISVSSPAIQPGRDILYLHGGAYSFGEPLLYRDFIWRVSRVSGARVVCIDYRLAPEHPFPAAVHDAVAAYRWMLDQGSDPRRLTVMGDSAGGGLTFATLLGARDESLPLPAASVALSPWTDLALTGESLARNAQSEAMLNPAQVTTYANWYLGDADARHPHASPLYGDLAGLPPSLIHVGGDEILLDDAVRMAEKLRAAGSHAELEVWPRMPHVWHLFARILPEARQALDRIGAFVQRHAA